MTRRSTCPRTWGGCLAAVLLIAGCTTSPGGSSVTCGPGTVLDGTVCLPAATGGADGSTPGGCVSNAKCGDGGVCVRASLTCKPAAGSLCGMPGAGTGSYPVGTRCKNDGDCAQGLTCVPGTAWGLDGGTGTYGPVSGTCLVACDPCNPACSPADSCIALGGGEAGGFCELGALRVTGEPCASAVCAVGTCIGAAAPTCSGPLCVPETDGGSPNSFSTGYPSKDCGQGQVCVLRVASIDGNIYDCEQGKIVPAGALCGARGPWWCGAGPCNPQLGVCYPGCTGTGACGTNGTCTSGVCVPNGAMGQGDPCLVTANCTSGLTCTRNRCQ